MVKKAESLEELLENVPVNAVIGDNLIRAWAKINSSKYKKIVCSISGGSDSDIMLNICYRCDKDNKIDYVWFDTGLEYQATKEHLRYLEEKYEIDIKSYKAIKAIPTCCKEYGQPFISKQISEFIQRLQKHNFKWEDKSFDELITEYPKCQSALEWWCNTKENRKNGSSSSFNISYKKYLKEFMIENPPYFKISNKCCQYAKKQVAHRLIKDGNYDLSITGVRRYEGGARATAYKSCFDQDESGCDNYRPLFWYKNEDKECYEKYYGIEHSRCYLNYGLLRTGCAACAFGRDFDFELNVIQKYEPKLYKAVNNIFGDSYEYTRKYKKFREEMESVKDRKGSHYAA